MSRSFRDTPPELTIGQAYVDLFGRHWVIHAATPNGNGAGETLRVKMAFKEPEKMPATYFMSPAEFHTLFVATGMRRQSPPAPSAT